jgi:hypothetical protein
MTSDACSRIIGALRAHGRTIKETGDRAQAQCPSHDDSTPSLSIAPRSDGRGAVICCHAGCDYVDILASVGLHPRDLFDDDNLRNIYSPTRDYVYPDGRQVHRKADKAFPQSHIPHNAKGALFHGDRVEGAAVVFWPEGEKDVEALEALGCAAVTSAMGAGKAHLCDASPLKGRHVVVVADRDEAGRRHATQVARLLDGVAETVSVVEAGAGKDSADHVAAGLGVSDFVAAAWYTTADTAEDTEGPIPDDEPVPLTNPKPLPPFPIDALPEPVAHMVSAVAEATQTDPAMAATSALSVLAALAGGHAEIEIRSGWRETLNLYTAAVAAPGERKSAVQQAITRPLLGVEKRLTETTMPAQLEALARKQIAQKEAERACNDAARIKGDDAAKLEAENSAIEAAKDVAAIEVPEIPRIFADDATPESVASLLAAQKGRLAILSAEGGVFDIIAGRYNGNVPNLDVWLKGHSGDPIRIDRKGRLPEYIPRPALTLGLMIQPEVLKSIAKHRVFRGRGLLARFLYAMPVSRVGWRAIATDPMPPDVVNAYTAHIETLASGLVGWAGDPGVLMLTPKAREAIEIIEAAVEPSLADDGELGALKDWGSKFVGAIARIAGIIHLAAHGSDTGVTKPVDATTIAAAYRIGEYFKAAAIAAFIEMATDQATADAMYLLARIEKNADDGEELSERDMHVATKHRFRKKEDLMVAVNRLVDHGYLIPQRTNTATGGRPASPRYRVRLL